MLEFRIRGYRRHRLRRALQLARSLALCGKLLRAACALYRALCALRSDADRFVITYVVLDLNGTCSEDGVLIPDLRQAVQAIVETGCSVYVLTGDIRGTARAMFEDWPVIVVPLTGKRSPAFEKFLTVESLGMDRTAFIGNGANDCLAALVVWSACVLQREGCSPLTAQNSMLLFSNTNDALRCLLSQKIMDAGTHM